MINQNFTVVRGDTLQFRLNFIDTETEPDALYFTVKDKENNNIEYDVCIDIFSECPTIEKTLIEESETEYLEGCEAYELLEKLLED